MGHDIKLLWTSEKMAVQSTSGGAFILIANAFLDNFDKSKVYGCVLDENNSVVHVSANKKNELQRMQGSKYVQSNINLCYSSVLNNLNNGIAVLFSGTACQIKALKCFLGKEYELLYTIDILCHGVPSPKFWKKYVEFLEKKYGGKISNIRFRNKSGTNRLGYVFMFECNGRSYRVFPNEDLYYLAFLNGDSLRPSCYQCPFVGVNNFSDVTLGDSNNKRFHPTEAISLIIENSEKGKRMLSWIEGKCEIIETYFEEECVENKKLLEAVQPTEKRKYFYRDIIENGIEQNYPNISSNVKLRNRLMNMMPIAMKDYGKKIINR